MSENQSRLGYRVGDAENKIEFLEGKGKGGRLVLGGPGDGKHGKDGLVLTEESLMESI